MGEGTRWGSRRHRQKQTCIGGYVRMLCFVYYSGKFMERRGTFAATNIRWRLQTKKPQGPQLYLLGISLIRQSPTCALQVKTPTEQYQVDGDGGEAAGTDTNELELGLGQEVMFYHYGEFKRGLAHVWIRHCFSQIVPPPLDMAYTCHCSFHLLIISWDCLCHYPPPFRYLCWCHLLNYFHFVWLFPRFIWHHMRQLLREN